MLKISQHIVKLIRRWLRHRRKLNHLLRFFADGFNLVPKSAN